MVVLTKLDVLDGLAELKVATGYRIGDRISVRINAKIFSFHEVPGKVEVLDSFFRHCEHELKCVVLVVDVVDNYIVDIEQEIAISFFKKHKHLIFSKFPVNSCRNARNSRGISRK